MIIFDLDGTLADCEHRRHFVDPCKNLISTGGIGECDFRPGWKPDWQAFYEACDKDVPIEPVCDVFRKTMMHNKALNTHGWEIWSGRCESVRDKTLKWLVENLCPYFNLDRYWNNRLKMRPIGNTESDEVLKERWLDEMIQNSIGKFMLKEKTEHQGVNEIDFVFDDRPKVIRMWRRRGIFVFNCCQHDEEF